MQGSWKFFFIGDTSVGGIGNVVKPALSSHSQVLLVFMVFIPSWRNKKPLSSLRETELAK
jgi:hypothetical protein